MINRVRRWPTWTKGGDHDKYHDLLYRALSDESLSRLEDLRTIWAHVPFVFVDDYGAKHDGSTDDSTAIQAAIDAAATSYGDKVVIFSRGTYVIGTTITVPSGVIMYGAGTQGGTYLSYTGAAQALKSPTAGTTRIYRWDIRGLYISTSTGTVGVDLTDVSMSCVENVVCVGFSSAGFLLDSVVSGGACVYNRIANCFSSGCAIGYNIVGASTNANILFGCRALLYTTGISIADSNDNTIFGCQVEGTTGTGIYITAAGAGTTYYNRIVCCRLEGAGAGINIASALVGYTIIGGTFLTAGATTTDLGLATIYWDRGSVLPVATKTTTHTITPADSVVVCNSTTAFTVTLPAATGDGVTYTVKNINTGLITLEGNSSDTIDGSLNATIPQWDSLTVCDYADNAWIII